MYGVAHALPSPEPPRLRLRPAPTPAAPRDAVPRPRRRAPRPPLTRSRTQTDTAIIIPLARCLILRRQQQPRPQRLALALLAGPPSSAPSTFPASAPFPFPAGNPSPIALKPASPRPSNDARRGRGGGVSRPGLLLLLRLPLRLPLLPPLALPLPAPAGRLRVGMRMDARHAIRRRRARGRALFAPPPVVEVMLLVHYPLHLRAGIRRNRPHHRRSCPAPDSAAAYSSRATPTPRAPPKPSTRAPYCYTARATTSAPPPRRRRPPPIQGGLPPSRGDERGRVLCGVRGARKIELLVVATVVAAVARRCLRGADAPRGLVDALGGPAVGDARDEAAVQDGESAGLDVRGRVYVPAGWGGQCRFGFGCGWG
ncbi:hypothetical protein B0H14DRAFT_541897 [Mycena olivaceomarginata]|nr:hypothetical protein B0H14DRAFT_541897 [Mycena olivaceomarginata]